MNKPLTFLLALTFLFLFSGSSVVFGDDLNDGRVAFHRQDYKEAVKWYRLAAEQGGAGAHIVLGEMYFQGQGVPQDYVSAHMWWSICGSSGKKECAELINIVKKKMTPSQIEKAQELARNWKPTTK